ncbi:MAG: RDD family protein [Nocardioides sp.]|nr:RDD family protein [Nocardioides sp.]
MSSPEFSTLTADDLVTGEAVALDLPPAGIGPRMLSGIIDLIVTALLLTATIIAAVATTIGTDEALVTVAVIGSLILVLLVVPTTVETLTRGKSVGKWALGLRTVRDDAGPITFQHALVRSMIAIVEVYAFTGAPAFFSALVSRRGKRLGDHAAGTYVVRERVKLQLTAPPPMPPSLASWARGADITSLPTGLALAVRQYLSRAAGLDPAARQAIGEHLVGQVAAHVAPPPPSGTPAEAYLAAVVASRRERGTARLQRDAALRRRLGTR